MNNNDTQETEDENWLPVADIMTGLFVVFLFIAIITIQNISKIESIFPATEDLEKSVIEFYDQKRELAVREDTFDKREAIFNSQQEKIYIDFYNQKKDYDARIQALNEKEIRLNEQQTNLEQRQNILDQDNYRIIADHRRVKDEIYKALMAEFEHKLPIWRAEIDPDTLVFRFTSPEILFHTNSAEVRPRFQQIISDFFPRYLRVLERFFPRISEIRIEGHTSSEWREATSEEEAFLKNMELSQDRTQSVLAFCLGLNLRAHHTLWVQKHITANGFSSTNTILTPYGDENKEASRRVEFKIYLDVEKVVTKIERNLDANP